LDGSTHDSQRLNIKERRLLFAGKHRLIFVRASPHQAKVTTKSTDVFQLGGRAWF